MLCMLIFVQSFCLDFIIQIAGQIQKEKELGSEPTVN